VVRRHRGARPVPLSPSRGMSLCTGARQPRARRRGRWKWWDARPHVLLFDVRLPPLHIPRCFCRLVLSDLVCVCLQSDGEAMTMLMQSGFSVCLCSLDVHVLSCRCLLHLDTQLLAICLMFLPFAVDLFLHVEVRGPYLNCN
jgi:hypothetical protein